MADVDITESELEAWLTRMLSAHYRTILKAPIIAVMITFSVMTFSGSIFKGILVGTVCLAASIFNTWRRYLEPIGFWIFLVAVVVWCDPSVPDNVRSGARQLSQIVLR
jgi:hypothetical protein